MSDDAPPPGFFPPPHLRDAGDAWVEGPDGGRYWGRFGAAGLLLWHREHGVLLQHRAVWSHFGNTWGLPGGARHENESAQNAAVREAGEEAGVPPDAVRVIEVFELDLGYWSYTTVIAEAIRFFDPLIGDPESRELRWVPVDEVERLPLHPRFGESWPELRGLLS